VREALIISAGMPRAGSGWYYNLVHDLVVADGGQDARLVREQYHLQSFLTEVNCNISTLKPFRLIPVMFPALLGNKYVIKTHAGPTDFTRWLHHRGTISTIYIFRDPRAALLSAYEYGQRGLMRNRQNAFSHLTSLESAAEFMRFYVHIWEAWSRIGGVLLVRYEDLVKDFEVEFKRLAETLSIDMNENKLKLVFDIYQPERGDTQRKGTHFSKGQVDRFRRVFTLTQLEDFTSMFKPELERMGYSD